MKELMDLLDGVHARHYADNIFPGLTRMLPKKLGLEAKRKQTTEIKAMLSDTIKEHIDTYSEDEKPRVKSVTHIKL